jgi:hypothetical protein
MSDTPFGPTPEVCVWCSRAFFDGETITVAHYAGKDRLHHGGCFEVWSAEQRKVAELFGDSLDVTMPDTVETYTRIHRKANVPENTSE